MKLFITGQKGVIGSIIWPRLEKMGHELTGYDLQDGEDILDTERLKAKMAGHDVVIHLAGIPGPWGLPWADYEVTNIEGTNSVIKALVANKIERLVYSSSGAVYGFSTGATRPLTIPMKEANPLPPEEELDNYDKSKIMCEQHIEEASKKHKFTGICLRLNAPYPHAAILDYQFFTTISEDNLAELFRAACETTKFQRYGAFNAHDRDLHPSVNSEEADAWMKSKYPDVPYTRQGRQPFVDITKAVKLLGYDPK